MSGRIKGPLEIFIIRRKLFPYEEIKMAARLSFEQFDDENNKEFSFEIPRIYISRNLKLE